MVFLQVFLIGFFAWRAFVYFNSGRHGAAIMAGLASLLFVTSLVVSALRPVDAGDLALAERPAGIAV